MGHQLHKNRIFDRDAGDALGPRPPRTLRCLLLQQAFQHSAGFIRFLRSDHPRDYAIAPFIHLGNDFGNFMLHVRNLVHEQYSCV